MSFVALFFVVAIVVSNKEGLYAPPVREVEYLLY